MVSQLLLGVVVVSGCQTVDRQVIVELLFQYLGQGLCQFRDGHHCKLQCLIQLSWVGLLSLLWIAQAKKHAQVLHYYGHTHFIHLLGSRSCSPLTVNEKAISN